MQQETRAAPKQETPARVAMKDHAFDRDLDDLGMSPEDLEREVESETETAAPLARQDIVVRH